MKCEIPEWATEKQKEGMQEFLDVATEYGNFDITFKQDDHDIECPAFYAVVEWENYTAKGKRDHEFNIAWDYEQTWDRYGNRAHHWQFLFAGGDATREISTEVFFLDLFQYVDGKADIAD